MKTPLELRRTFLRAARDGHTYDDQDLRDAGVYHADVSVLLGDMQAVASMATVDRTGADYYVDLLIAEEAEAAVAADAVPDQIAANQGILGGGTTQQDPSTHPSGVVLTQVAAGRTPPTVAQLTAAGFPDGHARETVKASAAVVAAGVQGRGLARRAGRRIAHTLPWPAPTDSWADIAAVVPPSTTGDLDLALDSQPA